MAIDRPRRIIHGLRRDKDRTFCGLKRSPLPAGTLIAENVRLCRRCSRHGSPVLFLDGDRRTTYAGLGTTTSSSSVIRTLALSFPCTVGMGG